MNKRENGYFWDLVISNYVFKEQIGKIARVVIFLISCANYWQ